MGGSASKVKEAYQLREGTEEIYWDRRWLRKIPRHTYQFQSLNKISLAHNSLNHLSPEIAQLPNLTELILCDNILSKLPPEFKALTKLTLLDLSDNVFVTMPVDVFQSLTNLHTLNMNNNRISTLSPDLTTLTHLNSLSLKGNKIESLPDQLSLLSLYVLDVSYNSICTLPKSLKHVHSLRMLQLSQNNISRVSSFRGLTNLVHLDLSYNRLSHLPPKMSYIVDTSSSHNQAYAELSIGKLRVLNVRENKDLFELPPEILNLRPPLTLYCSIPSGGLDCAANLAMLQHWNMTHVILAIADMRPHFPKNFMYHLLPDAKDSPSYDLSVHFEQCCKFIEEAQETGNVLIHCRAGISRSATITIAYVMKKHKMRFEEAFRFVSSKRPQIEPNVGFREQLMRYEVFLFDIHKIASRTGTPPSVPGTTMTTPRQPASRANSKRILLSNRMPSVGNLGNKMPSVGNGLDEIMFTRMDSDGDHVKLSSRSSSSSENIMSENSGTVVGFSNIGEL